MTEQDALETLFARAANNRATWHDFTQAFGAGSEHDPAVLGLRAYGGDLECARKFAEMLAPDRIWMIAGGLDAAPIAMIINKEGMILVDIDNQEDPARALMLAAIAYKGGEIQ